MHRVFRKLMTLIFFLLLCIMISAQEDPTRKRTVTKKAEKEQKEGLKPADQADMNKEIISDKKSEKEDPEGKKEEDPEVKKVKGSRPDMSKAKGARPPTIGRPSGSGIPKGAGKPGGAVRPGRR